MAKKLFRDQGESPKEILGRENPSGLKLRKAFHYKVGGWKPIKPEDLFDTKIGALWNEEARLIVEFSLDGYKYIVVSKQEDYEAMKRKHSDACVINVIQLIRIWTGVINDDYVLKVLPKVMMGMRIFKGAHVESVHNLG